jgi:hypothetical protein
MSSGAPRRRLAEIGMGEHACPRTVRGQRAKWGLNSIDIGGERDLGHGEPKRRPIRAAKAFPLDLGSYLRRPGHHTGWSGGDRV